MRTGNISKSQKNQINKDRTCTWKKLLFKALLRPRSDRAIRRQHTRKLIADYYKEWGGL